MKKLTILLIILWFLLSNLAQAETSASQIKLSVTVNPALFFSIEKLHLAVQSNFGEGIIVYAEGQQIAQGENISYDFSRRLPDTLMLVPSL